jgi:hypothetical protein
MGYDFSKLRCGGMTFQNITEKERQDDMKNKEIFIKPKDGQELKA